MNCQIISFENHSTRIVKKDMSVIDYHKTMVLLLAIWNRISMDMKLMSVTNNLITEYRTCEIRPGTVIIRGYEHPVNKLKTITAFNFLAKEHDTLAAKYQNCFDNLDNLVKTIPHAKYLFSRVEGHQYE